MLTFPIPLRLLCATDTRVLSEILRIMYRCLCGHLIGAAHLKKHSARTGAVTLIQRFGGSVNRSDGPGPENSITACPSPAPTRISSSASSLTSPYAPHLPAGHRSPIFSAPEAR